MARTFEHIGKTDHVGIDISAWIGQRIAHAGLRRKMHHRVEAFAFEQCCHTDVVADVALFEAEIGVLLQARQPCRFQCGIVIIVQIVDSHDRIAAREQLVGEGGADKTGRTGDQDSLCHERLFVVLIKNPYFDRTAILKTIVTQFGAVFRHSRGPQSGLIIASVFHLRRA